MSASLTFPWRRALLRRALAADLVGLAWAAVRLLGLGVAAFGGVESCGTAKARLQAAGLPEAYIPSMLGFYAAYRAGCSGTPTGHIEQLAGPASHALTRRDRRGTRRNREAGM